MAKKQVVVAPRKPSKQALERFIGEPAARAPNAHVPKTPSVAATPRARVTRADGRAFRRVTSYFPFDLGQRLAVYCAQQGVDMSRVVTEAVEQWLQKNA
jgi:hypothetical protein